MKISKRMEKVEFSAVRKLSPLAEEIEKKGKKIYHLNIGAPDVEVPESFFSAISNYDKRTLQYAPSKGLKPLREKISTYYKNRNINFNEDEIYITNGASEALLFTFLSIADKDDEILTTNPFYSNYKTMLDTCEIKTRVFNTSSKNGFLLPKKEEIEKNITDKTVAILLSNPTNPTGAVYSREELERIRDIAKKYDLYIISDEVYREFIYDNLKFTSMAELDDIDDRLILLDSISKRFGACGARIGSIASKNKKFLNSINKLVNSRLAVPTLEQIGAAALYDETEEYFKEVNEEYNRRRNTIYEELKKIQGVEVYKSKGAFYVMPTLPVEDAEDFSKWLLKDFDLNGETLMLAPADGFFVNSNEGKNKVRIAFVLNEQDLKKSCEILREGLKVYNEKK